MTRPMRLQDYHELKAKRRAAVLPPRDLCYACWRPGGFCYCAKIRKLALDLKFVILIHPLEEKRPIATGRMSYLCLKDSVLLEGEDFSEDAKLNELLQDPQYYPVILYPGSTSADLSVLSAPERQNIFPKNKTPLVIVIDGTWNTARKTMKKSRNLQNLPCIQFTPPTPSRIRVRHQPAKHCYTTIEAIHQVIDLLEPQESRMHDNLLEVLDYMVELQLNFIVEGKKRDEGPRVRKKSSTLSKIGSQQS